MGAPGKLGAFFVSRAMVRAPGGVRNGGQERGSGIREQGSGNRDQGTGIREQGSGLDT